MASKVKKGDSEKIKRVKYFAVLLDCIRGAGRAEQLAVILR
jgi:hypothetical protein